MGIANEVSQSPLEAALASGIQSISQDQAVSFTQYNKYVMPQDGYVFWVATANTVSFTGSLHALADRHQDEDQTIGLNKILFTSEQEITQFNMNSPTTMWIGTFGTLKVVFKERGPLYEQAGVWHYSGDAVYPALEAQLVASAADLPVGPIVSNSLPIWLSLNSFAPVYSSYLVPDNVIPPYIVAHIEPEETDVLQQYPIYQWPGVTGTGADPLHSLASIQLMKDKVKLILYGFTSGMAIQYLTSLIEYSLNTDTFGFCNAPAIRDEKRTQVEIAAIAMKKSIEIQASYYQGTADAIQRRLILSAAVTV